jgi:hypothetical protein
VEHVTWLQALSKGSAKLLPIILEFITPVLTLQTRNRLSVACPNLTNPVSGIENPEDALDQVGGNGLLHLDTSFSRGHRPTVKVGSSCGDVTPELNSEDLLALGCVFAS